MRTMQDWIDSYSADHRNPTNQVFHWFCVPPIVWSVIALLWAIPVPFTTLRPGSWAVLVMVLAFYWYWRRSHRLAAGLLIVFVAFALFTISCTGGWVRRHCATGRSGCSWWHGSASSSGTSTRDASPAFSPIFPTC